MASATRSWLFTPGTRIDRFAKAQEAGADVLIIDLEDAVAPDDKPQARASVIDFLKARPSSTIGYALRINGLDTLAGLADIQALAEHKVNPDYVVLPKTESPDHILLLDRLFTNAGIDTRFVGLIESARGLSQVDQIAGASGRLAGLMLGAADMAADLGSDVRWNSLYHARGRLITACAVARIMAIDSPFFAIGDADGLLAEVQQSRGMGFVAKAAIHPKQIGAINSALTPSAEEVDRARAILAENAKGVGVVDGQMIDEAVARKARRILAAAGD